MWQFGEACRLALGLIFGLDRELLQIVGLSLRVSVSATMLAFLIGGPCGLALAMRQFRGRWAILMIVNALLGLPSVVVGLVVYLLLSHLGPLGPLGLLFTPAAMIIAQLVLTLPIVVALVHRGTQPLWNVYGDQLLVDGASVPAMTGTLLMMARNELVTVVLAAFGRAISEVGAIMLVGGNIRGVTRTMTTAITLETSRGDLALALALGLILLSISFAASGIAFVVGHRDSAASGSSAH